MNRYTVTTTPGLRGYGILDRELYGFCTLADENKNLIPLEWPQKGSAEAWLERCYRTWERWERETNINFVKAVPSGWRPHPPEPSPWDRGWRFYNT